MMLRNLSILLLCGAFVFGVVWVVAPGFLERALPYLVESRVNQLWPPAPVAETAGTIEEESPRQAHSQQAADLQSSVSSSEESTAIENADTSSYPAEPSFEPRIFSISTETALYSANSFGGRVLRVLKKGEIVELQYTFINPGQDWTYVRVADQRVSGFLRSSSLGTRNPGDPTTP